MYCTVKSYPSTSNIMCVRGGGGGGGGNKNDNILIFTTENHNFQPQLHSLYCHRSLGEREGGGGEGETETERQRQRVVLIKRVFLI